jgi:hypothetical protein
LEVNDTLYPAVAWNNPADIVYPTLLSSTQLNATASVTGTFTYDPPAATLLDAGTGIELAVTFVPNDIALYSPVTKKVKINVNKAMPVITWNPPADIDYGTLLGNDQLNASSNVDGTFIYDPPAGTLLAVGLDQVLATTFAPSDTMNYDSVSASVNISVSQVTGITNLSVDNIAIHPVPVSDQLMISGFSAFGDKSVVWLQIVSAEGTVVRKMTTENTGGSKSIDVGNLPEGIYLLHLFTDDTSITRRFIKE